MTNQALSAFTNSAEHLQAEMQWVELVLRRRAFELSRRRGGQEKFDEFAGMYVSEAEIARYAEEPGNPHVPDDEQVIQLKRRAARIREELDLRLAETEDCGIELRLPRLARKFDLSPGEVRVLLFTLAPEIDLRFQRYYAYIQNDVSRRRPTIQLLAELCLDGRAAASRATFSPDGLLVRERLLHGAGREDMPFPARQPLVSETVADYLMGEDRIDNLINGFVSLLLPETPLPEADYYHRHRGIVTELLARLQSSGTLPVCYFWGPQGCGKSALVEAFAQRVRVRLMRVDLRAWLGAGAVTGDLLRAIRRDARLHGCLLELSRCEALLAESAIGARFAIESFLKENQTAGIVLTGTSPVEELCEVVSLPVASFEIPRPDAAERAGLWRNELEASGVTLTENVVGQLASCFRFTPLEIRRVLEGGITGADVASALMRRCRENSRHALHRFARKITPRRGWDDLVLPPDMNAHLAEICNAVRKRTHVYSDWGFEAKLALGSGLCVLFSGPSGVGKTMSAEIIAGDLGLDLYAVDLSCIVSKYIGETEKQLSKVFDEAESTNGVLFFDECDALFGKRTEVKDSHDRYANIEVNYLLQRMDRFEGVVILATNLKSNLDAAFMRRLRYVVEFPFPQPPDRERIWRKVFPAETPLASDVDFAFLARQFKLAGGNIKNIALNAAFLAAGDSGKVSMRQLILAARRELQKIGRTYSKADFGRYYSWVAMEVND
ncbi:MAG: ATP-binding protein [Acidobacteria bacterium]|nr:ATP-binding protein [Acidobacteriota bacterium]